jgi:hypothetical protein
VLCQCTRNPNAPSREFGFALCCEQGGRLHYFEAFIRRRCSPSSTARRSEPPEAQPLIRPVLPLVDRLAAITLSFFAFGLRTSLFDLFWPLAMAALLTCRNGRTP